MSTALHNSIRQEQYRAFDQLAVPAVWTQARAPFATLPISVGFKSLGWRDQELINAYGIGAKIFTIKVSDILMVEKFDKIAVDGESYTLNSVMPAHVGGLHVYHKCVARGK